MFTSLNLKLALGASSLALAAAWVVQPDPGTEPHALAPAPQDGAVASAEPGTRELVHASAAGQDRESVAAPAALAAAAPAALVASLPGDPAHTFVIEGVVVGGDDRPVGGAHVFLAPALHPFNLAVDTESDGSFRAVWKGRGPAMSVAVAVRSSQGWIGLDQVDVVAGRPLSLRLGVHNTGFVRRAVMVEQLVVNGKYQDVPIYANAQVRREVEAAAAKLKASLDLAAQKRYLSTDLAWEDPLAGVFRTDLAAKLGQQELLAAIAAVDDAELLERVRTLEVAEVARVGELKKRKALAELGLQFGSGEAPPAGPQTILTGLVLDELGQPVPRASVLVRTELESHSHLTRDDGTFRLERLPVETELTVEIGGGDDGLARAILSSPADGETFHYEAVLDRGLELAGVLRDEHGAPLAGWLVEDVVAAAPGAGPWYDSTVTGEDGSFAIPNLPDAAGELYLRPAADWHPIPQHVVHGARAGGAELELVVPAESLATGGLSLVVQGSAGRVLPEAEVRVWHADTGRGTWAVWNAEAGVFALDGLSAGRYRVEAGSRVDGWVDLGEVWIAAGERVELGTVHLPEPGTLHVAFELGPEPDAASLTWSLSHLRDDVESALETTSLESALEGPIAPGEYLVRVAGEDFGTHVLALEVRSGETTEATLSLADARPALLRFVPADGASFGEEPVRYVLQDPETARPVLQQVLEPDADGNATTRVFLVSGSYRLTAGASGGALGAGTAIEVGTGPVEVVLE